jgi:hypothetical protein
VGQGESKLKYQQAVLQLIDNANLPANDLSFWAQFWTLPKSVEEVFAAISPTDIREIKKKTPSNLATLLNKVICVDALCYTHVITPFKGCWTTQWLDTAHEQ